MTFGWVDGARTRGLKIENVAPVLERIVTKAGCLTPEAVLREARKPRSPIRSWFDWDDKDAAHQHRLTQARELIRAVTIRIIPNDTDATPVRAYVHLGTAQTYESTISVLGDAERRAILLDRALRELEMFRAKYKTLRELAAVFEAMDKVAV